MKNDLVRKLLHRHLSWGQLLGFFLANLLGMCIVLLSLQFYQDVLPLFNRSDSFMKPTYMVIGKRVSAIQTLKGETPRFTQREMADLGNQPFVRQMGGFLPAQFDVFASIGGGSLGMGFSTDMFFESLPDRFVDADPTLWRYIAGSDTLPVILPRNYLNLYNFGFAATKGLPALSEGLIGMVNLHFRLRGSQGERHINGRVVAFSDRINTILVPQDFLEEANHQLSPDRPTAYSRLMLEVENPADSRIAPYLQQQGYEAEAGADDAGQAAYFLRVVIGMVLLVGLVICALAFYVLLLSIFLLLQKQAEKMDTLLLIGYSPSQVARPFHWLSGTLNAGVLLISWGLVALIHSIYYPIIAEIYPALPPSSPWAVIGCGLGLFLTVAILDYWAVRRKVMQIWYSHRQA